MAKAVRESLFCGPSDDGVKSVCLGQGVVAACLIGSLYQDMTPTDCLDAVQAGYTSRQGLNTVFQNARLLDSASTSAWAPGLRRGSKLDVGALAKSPQTEEQRDFVRVWLSQTRAR